MRYPIRFPDGRTFGPYTLEELKQYSGEGKFPPNTEIEAGGEWVSLGGWLVVRKRVEQLAAAEASQPKAAPPPSVTQHSTPQNSAPQRSVPHHEAPVASSAAPPMRAIAIGAALFVVVIAAALFLRVSEPHGARLNFLP